MANSGSSFAGVANFKTNWFGALKFSSIMAEAASWNLTVLSFSEVEKRLTKSVWTLVGLESVGKSVRFVQTSGRCLSAVWAVGVFTKNKNPCGFRDYWLEVSADVSTSLESIPKEGPRINVLITGIGERCETDGAYFLQAALQLQKEKTYSLSTN